MVKLKVETVDDWMALWLELQKVGLLSKVTANDALTLPKEAFPIEVELDLEPILNLLSNPMVKPFKKKIDATLTNHVVNVMTTAMAR